jgi:hypothetical protein
LVRERASSPYQYILLVTAKDDKQDLVRGLEAAQKVAVNSWV